MKRRKKVATTVYIEHEQFIGLAQASRDVFLPQAVIIRHGIDLVLSLINRPETIRTLRRKYVESREDNSQPPIK